MGGAGFSLLTCEVLQLVSYWDAGQNITLRKFYFFLHVKMRFVCAGNLNSRQPLCVAQIINYLSVGLAHFQSLKPYNCLKS